MELDILSVDFLNEVSFILALFSASFTSIHSCYQTALPLFDEAGCFFFLFFFLMHLIEMFESHFKRLILSFCVIKRKKIVFPDVKSSVNV